MRISTVIILMGALAAGGAVWVGQRKNDLVVVSSIATTPEVELEQVLVEPKESEASPSAPLPSSVMLAAPFLVQAPHADWSQPYQDACEEAAMIMLHEARVGTTTLTPDEVDERIRALVDFQTREAGDYKDTNAKETAAFAEEYFHEDYNVLTNVTLEHIKRELVEGHLIAAPMAGRLLGNPNFTPPGPLYHMLVIRGYDDATQQFITNDPGTRKGENYRYSYEVLMSALHDFPGSKERMNEGAKTIIVSQT